MSCPYCGRTDNCPHWESDFNVWSRNGKGSYIKSFLYGEYYPWSQDDSDLGDFYIMCGSSSATKDCTVIRKRKI